ncbi:hypothetical protein JAAARDRAFT_36655 [Jaapia argillacea MUCL 33604]|uniref:Uncharacterized protein n=1 Tax=Jaapia argillacea MUCL 33604 TaxID=933084 RepID=A0A067PLV3_9AGAM|nr:hypothetical protein JAAARDRAFT_36655 [Jaapia argillacea MUCL 33604]
MLNPYQLLRHCWRHLLFKYVSRLPNTARSISLWPVNAFINSAHLTFTNDATSAFSEYRNDDDRAEQGLTSANVSVIFQLQSVCVHRDRDGMIYLSFEPHLRYSLVTSYSEIVDEPCIYFVGPVLAFLGMVSRNTWDHIGLDHVGVCGAI